MRPLLQYVELKQGPVKIKPLDSKELLDLAPHLLFHFGHFRRSVRSLYQVGVSNLYVLDCLLHDLIGRVTRHDVIGFFFSWRQLGSHVSTSK